PGTFDPLDLRRLLQHLLDDRLVETRLLLGQMAVDAHFDLLRQAADDLLVGLQAAQNERTGRPAQTRCSVLVAEALDRSRIAALERRRRAQQPRVEEVHDRVQLGQSVLYRRARERDAVTGFQRADRTRLLGVDRLNILRLVKRDPLP